MHVFSLARSQTELTPLEIELTLVPGLPSIQFLGLPDAVIRESAFRIKSALRAQGFQFPVSQKVLVQLNPNHIPKSSRGLDLGVAAALLWQTQQIPPWEQVGRCIFYGETTLEGAVLSPDDLLDFVPDNDEWRVVTGAASQPLSFGTKQVKCLKELLSPKDVAADTQSLRAIPPQISSCFFSATQARLLAIASCGEHPTLLAGPSGSGKSTLASKIQEVLAPPSSDMFRESLRIHRSLGLELTWRPFVNPHHTTTSVAMVGGGAQISLGEITRAHGGALLMDEFLEFPKSVHEALREPLEMGSIKISRLGKWSTLPAHFVLIATTNLCSCGGFVPGTTYGCRCPNHQRLQYMRRLSGPLLDRFHILAFSNQWLQQIKGKTKKVSVAEIRDQVWQAREFARQTRGQDAPNSRLDTVSGIDDFALENFLPPIGSQRRKMACMRVARTVADLEGSQQICPRHWHEATKLTIHSFEALRRDSTG